MMHWRAEPLADPTPARSRRPMPPTRPADPQSSRPFLVRFLTLAIAALLTANGVVVAEQASGRDLITLGRDGVDNAREAIARLLDDQPKDTKVAGVTSERETTTTTAAAETTTTTAAPAVVPAPVETPTTAPPAVTPTTAKKAAPKDGTDWAKVSETVRPYVEKETSVPFKG